MSALLAAERLDETIAASSRLIEHYPNVPEFHVHRAAATMKLGRSVIGYREFAAWAYRMKRVADHRFNRFARWEPDTVDGGGWRVEGRNPDSPATLHPSPATPPDVYVWNAEGAGDHFQFIRFAKAMAADGWTVRSVSNAGMNRLLARVPGVASVVDENEDGIPPGTVMAPLPMLPAEYLGNVPTWDGPYLSADDATVETWRRLHSTEN